MHGVYKVAKERVNLKTSDWEILFPVEDFKIGSTVLELKPLSLNGLAAVIRKITSIIDKITMLEIDLNNFQANAGKIVELVGLILSDAPDVLSEMSDLDVEDIKRLPLDTAVSLFDKCLDVNLRSQESLTKNFQGLGVKVAKFMGSKTTVQ